MTVTRGTVVGALGASKMHVPATWNGYGRLPIGYTDTAAPASRPLSVGLIVYDDWWKGAYEHVPEIGQAGTLRTNFTHRQPLAYDPNCYASDPTLATISLVREQQITDQLIQDCVAGGITYWAIDWYPTVEMQDLANYPSEAGHENLLRNWQRYQQSAYRSQLNWCWTMTAGWLRDATNAQRRIDWMVASVDDQYLRAFPARPVFYLFDYVTGALRWDITWSTALRNSCKAAGKGNPYLIGMGYTSTGAATAGLDARSAYGPLDVALGAGQNNWAAMAAADVSKTQFTHATINAVPHLSGGTDMRPISGLGWADPATCSQWVTHVKGAKTFIDANPANCPQNMVLIYSMNELAERGGILGTAQNDVHASGRGWFFDGIAHAIGKTTLTSVIDSCGPLNLTYVSSSAGWAVTNAVSGAYESCVIETTTAASYTEGTFTTVANGTIRVYGSKGPAYGVVSFTVDGGAPSLVDCYNATVQRNQLLFTASSLSAAAHTVRATYNGTKNALSSNTTISIDQFTATVAAP